MESRLKGTCVGGTRLETGGVLRVQGARREVQAEGVWLPTGCMAGMSSARGSLLNGQMPRGGAGLAAAKAAMRVPAGQLQGRGSGSLLPCVPARRLVCNS